MFCFDPDERAGIDLNGYDLKNYTGVRLRLFDFYITPEDMNKEWYDREWIGPEFRDILMMVRPQNVNRFIDREAFMTAERILRAGFVRHYGKAISVENWEAKCTYYAEHLPEPYKSKWESRRGNAIKWDMKSDFGSPLIKWDERDRLGFGLTSSIEAKEARKNIKI